MPLCTDICCCTGFDDAHPSVRATCCREAGCPCATPSTRRSDRHLAPLRIPGSARAPRSTRHPGSGTKSSDCRRRASVSQGPVSGCRRHCVLGHYVRCSDGASGHSGGWPARGSAASLRTSANRAPTRPGFDRGGKGSNPARRDHSNPTRGLCRRPAKFTRRSRRSGNANRGLAWACLLVRHPSKLSPRCAPGPVRRRRSLWRVRGSATICPWQRP